MPLSMGNPGPIGFVYGGFTQWIAGILSVLRGDSYSGSLFTLYGGYWMAFGVVGMISADPTAEWAQEEVKARMVHGIAGLKILFGVITFLYWTLSHRKTIILWLILPNVYMLLFLGAYSLLTGSEAAKVISGYFGFAASCLALYSFYGELVNEEYGRHVQPQT